ncbi:MAG: hypothetical protein HC802_04655 [Caldilineaceae bacterium]|nr:hypothetical protein [Caldilineaceae bacterium]
MIPHSPRAKVLTVTILAFALLAGIFLAVYWNQRAPASEPPPTPTADVDASPPENQPRTAEPVLRPIDPRAHTQSAAIFTVTLPATWQWVELTDAGQGSIANKSEELTGDSPFGNQLQTAATTTRAIYAIRTESAEIDKQPSATLRMTHLPREGLHLEEYLAASDSQLKELDPTIVVTATIRDDLHPMALPAATLQIDRPPPLANPPQTIYQIVFLDGAAEELIVATFATESASFPDLQPEFDEIVQQIELAPPP